MMGDKMLLLFWNVPEYTDEKWTLTVTGKGIVRVRWVNKVTFNNGELEFSEDTDFAEIKRVLTMLGFTESK